jgi:predicted Fe-S protein YdhL (DUF1289 family)
LTGWRGSDDASGIRPCACYLRETARRGIDVSDDIWRRDEIESPCIKICLIHPEARICTGCHRTIDEIGGWSRMTSEDRRAIMEALPERAATLARMTVRRGGRAGRLKR